MEKANWPEAQDKQILFGDRKVIELIKKLKIDANHVSAVVRHFRMVKDSCEVASEDSQWNKLNHICRRLVRSTKF